MSLPVEFVVPNLTPAATRLLKIDPGKAECEWQRLCDKYLPVRPRGSVWRFSRKWSRNDPSQGWKIHVSAAILSACTVLRSVAPYLRQRKLLFKAPNSLDGLHKLNAGIFYGFSQVGKFITIYPESTETAVALARELDRLIGHQPAPAVPYDNRLRKNSCIYYRYGGFSDATVVFRSKKVPAIVRRDGKLVPDRREPGAAVPKWLTDPFQRARVRTALEVATPLETDYTDYEAFLQRGRGGIYQARDISSPPAKLVVIKEGRRHGETDWLGRDGYDRIKGEAQFLKWAGIAALPRIIRTFRANGCYYLVMECIAGKSLQQVLASRERISTRRLLKYCAEMAGIVADIHATGWAWRDCKPANFLVQKAGKMRALDFEGVCRLHKTDPLSWRTPYYMPPGWPRNAAEAEVEDLYALGTSMMQLIARGESSLKLAVAFQQEIKKRRFPERLVGTIRTLRSLNSEIRPSARAAQRVLEKVLGNSN